MNKARQNFDEVAWDRNDEAWEKSQKQLRLKSTCRLVESLAAKVLGKRASLVSPIFFGGFNVLYRIHLEGHDPDVIVRLPCPDLVQFPEEKTLYEAATMACLAQNTPIPVPAVFHYTSSSDVGPVIILQHVETTRDMSDALAIPSQDPDETPVLNPSIDEETLRRLYKNIALLFQHNDLVRSEDDCRNKYVARYLFHLLAKQGRLSSFGFVEDNWSQEDDVIAAIDWEFTYVSPTQFILDPPWWLLLEVPEMWSSGMDDWASTYDTRLKAWLLAMEDIECASVDQFPFKLSSYMRESWLSGRFWLNYASRKSWAFDAIYWKYLDERFFGPRETNISGVQLWKTRIHLLGEEQRRKMDMVVQRKMEEAKERALVDWDPSMANNLLHEALRDSEDLKI
ncbi:uncharacterized protein NECHADRAFT_29954 [Fusarium vanettenii 77-13-4]|uniref:Aminoglycoside phosphotransferase domain-containing protein n=1 Tax=Fusarium vanettenii (strain ATCC MYA-4622 / CBS 123669 / FGSC 9596 / NRRL 45880 / 77-13-4) TaxID=660122 RepID=C7YVP7_FUSV7|nr:uncharacterized protein NECHADRAFT_29954 [Fusarium vanettenii 77-13-4]EEU43829.1 hypothetical protein NECHADRAFT_29954 [Fusarium vanettenii 77-13-4]